MIRVTAFIDGFNLYHSLDDLRDPRLKWVNLWALCERLVASKSDQLLDVFYFSAFAEWKTDRVSRHRQYVAALQSTGVLPVMGHFKAKSRNCRACGAHWTGHEEKETDLNIGLQMLDQAYQDNYDTALLITRDSDLAPAVRLVKERFPKKKIIIVAPPHRGHSTELLQASDGKRKIKRKQLEECLFPRVVVDHNGDQVAIRPDAYS